MLFVGGILFVELGHALAVAVVGEVEYVGVVGLAGRKIAWENLMGRVSAFPEVACRCPWGQ